ncbi:hypothetical protein GUJ93_ZPchr0004g38739 [Zizania palustris]|uniref:Uncharacterized protein n=1 Tax=Zizania palustris TaxID=103762 RepID=A0A8J5SAB6_ZIZPA|nr:hypothetical protein GUJ93_ZPchr0004g38739 [Zizania palustris]
MPNHRCHRRRILLPGVLPLAVAADLVRLQPHRPAPYGCRPATGPSTSSVADDDDAAPTTTDALPDTLYDDDDGDATASPFDAAHPIAAARSPPPPPPHQPTNRGGARNRGGLLCFGSPHPPLPPLQNCKLELLLKIANPTMPSCC